MRKCNRVTMTHSLAMAAAKDHADRRMRKDCRSVWNEDDYNAMVTEFNRLYPLDQHLEFLRSQTASSPERKPLETRTK